MEENTLNISKIVIECLKTVGKVDYTDMTSKFECSSQTLLNWRQGNLIRAQKHSFVKGFLNCWGMKSKNTNIWWL